MGVSMNAENLYVFLPDDGAESLPSPLSGLVAAAATIGTWPSKASHLGRRRGHAFAAAASADVSEAAISDEQVGLVYGTVPDSGAALVEVKPEFRSALSSVQGGTYHPQVYYETAVATPRHARTSLAVSSGPQASPYMRMTIKDTSGQPVALASVGVNLSNKPEFYTGVTDVNGNVFLAIRATGIEVQSIHVEPGFSGHWGYIKSNTIVENGATIIVERIDLTSFPDALRRRIAPGTLQDGQGVTVGVIDTGIGPHPDLPHTSGDEDTVDGHGSHVAGIIGGRGANGFGGIAPGVRLRSYNVFEDPSTGKAASFDIHRAIMQAARDGCQIINMSLKIESVSYEPVVGNALKRATDMGSLIFAAAGNDFGKPVSFPARNGDVVAVAAFGSEEALPKMAYDRWAVSKHKATTSADLFFAAFSNEGPEIDLIAPGVGIVSTVPGNRYAPMSGTSMASPVAAGFAAKLLSKDPEILSMPATRARRDALLKLLQAHARRLGFGPTREGRGFVS